jgi:class 3 adenylate cyclase
MVTIGILAVVCCGLVGGFLWSLHAGRFSRMERGFLATMVLAIAGFAFLGSAVSGVISYLAGRQIVEREIVAGLGSAGDIAEAALRRTVQSEIEQLHQDAKYLAGALAAGDKARLTTAIASMDQLNNEILQISVFDSHTSLVASSFLTSHPERADLVAVANALEGREYVSDAYLSPVTGTWVLAMAVPIPGTGQPAGALTLRYDLESELSAMINSTQFGADGYAVIANNAGRVLAHPTKKRVNADISAYTAHQRAKQGQSGSIVARNLEGQQRLFVYRPVRSPASGNPLPWVLLVEADQARAVTPIRSLRNQVLIAVLALTIGGILAGRKVALSVSAPLKRLVEEVRKVEGGDFTGRVFESPDEVGRLGAALNQMAKGLEERDRVKELFGRYVATQISDKLVKGEINLAGESRSVTILFSDIRDFTAMSEQMTPAQVVAFLNDYFSEMVEAVLEQGGILDKFIGDGLMAVFGSFGDMPDHPRRAVRAALRMKARLAKINGDRSVIGKPPIKIGIGIHTDTVIVGNIGSRRRLEYTVIGDGVNTCSRVQALNKEFGTTLLITDKTFEMLKDEFECRLMPETELRGKTHAVAFYEVLSAKAPDYEAGRDNKDVATQLEINPLLN